MVVNDKKNLTEDEKNESWLSMENFVFSRGWAR